MDDCIFDFVYIMAMTDATKRTSSAAFKDDLIKNSCAKEVVKGHIDNILKNKPEDVMTVITIVTNLLKNDKNCFSFGNAQKLVNMTVKYFYIMTYNNINDRSLFRKAHCPMDRKMRDIVVKKYKAAIAEDDKQKNKRIEYYSRDDSGGETSDWSNIAWSKMDDRNIERYRKFQEMVSYLCEIDEDSIYPIDYDYKYFPNA